MPFISDQYRLDKTLLAVGTPKAPIERAGALVTLTSGEPDPRILVHAANVDQAATDFIAALGRHRRPEPEAGATAP
jgi:hypothetical protein